MTGLEFRFIGLPKASNWMAELLDRPIFSVDDIPLEDGEGGKPYGIHCHEGADNDEDELELWDWKYAAVKGETGKRLEY